MSLETYREGGTGPTGLITFQKFCCLSPPCPLYLSFSLPPSLSFLDFLLFDNHYVFYGNVTSDKNTKMFKAKKYHFASDFTVPFAVNFTLASFRHLSCVCFKVHYITIFNIIFLFYIFSSKTFAKRFLVFRCFLVIFSLI